MTDFSKLADALENIAQMEYPSAHHDGNNLREAAALLRSAAVVDLAGLMALFVKAADARAQWLQYGHNRADAEEAEAALESALRLVLAQRVPPGCVVVPVERLTVEEIKTLRQQVRNDPRCQDEHWFVLMARAIEDRYLAAALTDQSQKKESP